MSTKKLAASLNPNAEEFVPFALKGSSAGTGTAEGGSTSLSGTSGKLVVDRSPSSISNHSDEDFHLPDDITLDFNEDISHANSMPFSALSLQETNQRPSSSSLSSPHGSTTISTNFLNASAKPWDRQIQNKNQFLSLVERPPYNGNSTQGFLNEQPLSGNTEVNPLEFLGMQFPGFASESLMEVYIANGCDMNLTVEMLTQLELQVDGGLNQNLTPKALSAPNLTPKDFPALSMREGLNTLPNNSYLPPNKDNLLMFNSKRALQTKGAIDFATALAKMPPQESGSIWKYEKKPSLEVGIGSSRSSHVLASSYNGGQGRSIYSNRVPSQGSSRAAPWLDTGDAVANMYSEMREEARDYARLRNVYHEQAQRAYMVGNKALAKELSMKGHEHNMRMKAAHDKAQESIFRQRNPVSPAMQRQEKLIDLHGLHVTEALHVLKRELTILRTAARSADQRFYVFICVGTGHHTHGARTPVRLPVAVQRYLLEEEGLDYTEPQPGMLRVLLF